MERQARVVWILAASLTGGVLALVGAPAPPPLPPVDADSGPRGALEAPVRELIEPVLGQGGLPVASPAPAEQRVAVDAARSPSAAQVPLSVSVCWSPTARRLLGPKVHALLANRGARVDAHLESNLGAASRVARGLDDLALVAGEAAPIELPRGVIAKTIGYHVLVPIVHAGSDVTGLTSDSLHRALTGAADNWSHMGSARRARIDVVAVEESPFSDQASALVMLGDRLGAGTRRLGDDDAVATFVAGNPNALGLCSLAAAARANVRVLNVNAVTPGVGTHLAGLYPFATPVRVLARDAQRLTWLEVGALAIAVSAGPTLDPVAPPR